jgi:hypothetical protein
MTRPRSAIACRIVIKLLNARSNPYLFRDTLMKLIDAPVLEYKKLTAA